MVYSEYNNEVTVYLSPKNSDYDFLKEICKDTCWRPVLAYRCKDSHSNLVCSDKNDPKHVKQFKTILAKMKEKGMALSEQK
jgi:hypothetical protein